jgi:hypothetical protein
MYSIPAIVTESSNSIPKLCADEDEGIVDIIAFLVKNRSLEILLGTSVQQSHFFWFVEHFIEKIDIFDHSIFELKDNGINDYLWLKLDSRHFTFYNLFFPFDSYPFRRVQKLFLFNF